MRLIVTLLAFALFFTGPTWSQVGGGAPNGEDVQKGHTLGD